MMSPEVAPELENPMTRRAMLFAYNSTIKCGRFFASACQCFYAQKEHKLCRSVTNLAGGVVAKKFAGVEYQVTSIAGVPCRVYRPKTDPDSPKVGYTKMTEASSELLPVIVYLHGGGWTIGSARGYHGFTGLLARDTAAIVVSVDYSLAPERPYPNGYEDCLAVVRCVLNADAIQPTPFISGRVDTSRVVVAGDSAGGNLAGCVALDLVRAGDRRLKGLVLICPAMQALNFSFPSYNKFCPPYGLEWFVAHYAGARASSELLAAMRRGEHLSEEGVKLLRKYVEKDEAKAESTVTRSPIVPPKLSELCSTVSAWPMLADDEHLAQLPKTFMQASEFDPLLDENMLFADRLKNCGADAKFVLLENAEHVESVFHQMLKSRSGLEGYNQIVNFIEEQFR